MNTIVISQSWAGLNLFVAITLMFAAIGKSRGIQSVERLLVDTLPRRLWHVRGVDSRRVAWSTVVVEAVSGLTLLITPREAYPAASGAVVIPLIIVIAVAFRAAERKVPCICFGASRRKAGIYEVGRAAVLALTMLTLCALTWSDSDVDPTVGSLTVWGWAVAVLLMVSAVAPTFRLTRSSRPSPTETGQDPRGTEHSRRSVLSGVGLAAVMIGASGMIPKNVVTAGACKADGPQCRPQCQAAYDLCVGANPGQKPCCIDCYVACQGVGKTCSPGVSCAGAWPNPSSFGY